MSEATADNTRSAIVGNERTSKRDDFKAAVKVLLAQRVGYLCSNPNCQRPTIGPKNGASGAHNVGVAAHVAAASPGGARYDENQTAEERSGFDNGIWLCTEHAHIIDHDEKEFTVEILREWKRKTEERAFHQLLTGRGPATVHPAADELLDELRELKTRLSLPQDADLASIRMRVIRGTLTQVEAFEATPRWPPHLVKPELSVEDEKHPGTLNLSRFPQVLMAVQKIVVQSAPGTGKTTTLLQLARSVLATGLVPVFVPLGEWAETGTDLFGWIVGRHGYEGLSANHMTFLSSHGELVLLLDGWNEVRAGTRRRLIKELEGLQRDFPLLYVVVSTRREALDVPIPGRRFAVLPLLEGQQAEIARAIRGDDGVRLLDAAWRTVGLRDLVSIPFYLRTLMETSTSGNLPETKEEVLRRMVQAHEADPANAELLHRELMGLQQRYLAALAISAQLLGSTTLPRGAASSAVGRVNRALIEEGLTATPPNAQSIMDILVAGHSVVQAGDSTYAFQHQQIQEWYASLELETALRAEAGKLTLDHPLVTQRLNDPGWEEPILFSCERMARSDGEGARTVADVVELLLKIDPLFAAKVISRSGPSAWEIVRDAVMRFALAWHQPGGPDRAIGFMIASGRSEFADTVWPLLSGEDDQLQMQTMRIVRRFNPAVLGEHLARDYASLPERTRGILVSELALYGDRAGIEAAYALALTEPSMKIRHRVFEGLSFRNATREVEALLRNSGDGLTEAVARQGYLDCIRDKALLDGLEQRRRTLLAADQAPERRLNRALSILPAAEMPAVIKDSLQDPAFSFQDLGGQVTAKAATRFPEVVAETLKWRVENRLELPFRPFDYLDAIPPTDSGPIVSILLNEDITNQGALYAAYFAGPDTARELTARFLAARQKYRDDGIRSETAYAPARNLAHLLENTRATVLFEALHAYAGALPPEVICDLSEIISRHGTNPDRGVPTLSVPHRASVVALLNGWGSQLLSQAASRHDMGQLTWAMRRFPDPSQVDILAAMLDADLALFRKAKEAFLADRRNETALDEMRHSHTLDYRVALTAVGTPEAEAVFLAFLSDPDFGPDAAVGLQVIWQNRNEPRSEGIFRKWPDFERAAAHRAMDRSVSIHAADAIFVAVKAARAEGTSQGYGRALQLAGCAVLMPHGERSAELDDLLSGDVDGRSKLGLVQRMVVGGLVVPHSLILTSLQQMVAKAGDRKWLGDNEMGEIVDWLELLPFSDNPTSMFNGIDLLASWFEPSVSRLRDIIDAVRYLPEFERTDLLRGLVQRYPKLIEDYNLYLAMPKPEGPTLDFLVEIAAGHYGEPSLERVTPHDYPRQIYEGLPQREREELSTRFASARGDREKAFLAMVLLASADHEIFLMLAPDHVGRRVISQHGRSVEENLLYTHEPIGRSTSSYELIPRDIQVLRKGLFQLAQSGDPELAVFAADYLNRIDATRDEDGGIDAGPRHPDIGSGRPWPNVTIPAKSAAVQA